MTEFLQSLRSLYRRREYSALLLQVDPDVDYGHERVEILSLAANAALQSGTWERGVILLEELCRRRPDEPALRRNLSHCCNELAREDAGRDSTRSETWYRRALSAWPDNPAALFNYGRWQRARGQASGALSSFEHLLALAPADIDAAVNVAELRFEDGDFPGSDAVARCLDPDAWVDTELLGRLAALLERLGLGAAARRAYRRLLALQPSWQLGCKAFLGMTPVPADREQLLMERRQFEQGLEHLDAAGFRGLAEHDARWANFLLAYQGLDDHTLLARYGDVLAAALAPQADPLPAAASGTRRPLVCMVSSGFRDCTVGAYFGGWIDGLRAGEFDVVAYQLGPHADATTESLLAGATDGAVLAGVPELVSAIASLQADVLLYPELGMDHRLLPVAARRFAPVQIAAWGHPETTGLGTIDFFVTCAAMEPEGSATHYREKLIPLPGIGTRYQPPTPPTASQRQRRRLGLPEQVPLLLQPQSSFKIHPDNDELMARCLARVPHAVLVLFQDSERGWQHRLNGRLAREFALLGVDFDSRVIVLPRMQRQDYLAVNACCTVMLDSRHFSGGNTSLDALSVGLPVVTWPGELMRGRQSLAMLRRLGVDELVAGSAEQYVALVEMLCLRPGLRADLGERIIAGRGRLFDDPEPAASLARQLRAILDKRAAASKTGPG